VLARLQAGDGLRGVHLRGRAQDDGVHFLQRQAVGQVGGDVADAVLGGGLFGLVQSRLTRLTTLHAVDQLDGVEVLDAEGAGAGQRNFDGSCRLIYVFSRIRWPTAVFARGHMVEAVRHVGCCRAHRLCQLSAMAPRAISHITSSMPSLPASRT
jgi:hypothetical protein